MAVSSFTEDISSDKTQSPCSPRQIKTKFAARPFRADCHFPISYIPLSGFWKHKYGEADMNS